MFQLNLLLFPQQTSTRFLSNLILLGLSFFFQRRVDKLYIQIIYRLEADSKRHALFKGRNKLEEVIKAFPLLLEEELNEKFPKAKLRVGVYSPLIEEDGEGFWAVSASFELCLEHEVFNDIELEWETEIYSAHSVWNKLGCPLNEDVSEPLFSLDWSKVKESCKNSEIPRLSFSLNFHSIKLVVTNRHGTGFDTEITKLTF